VFLALEGQIMTFDVAFDAITLIIPFRGKASKRDRYMLQSDPWVM
jgi:hypothetical protein